MIVKIKKLIKKLLLSANPYFIWQFYCLKKTGKLFKLRELIPLFDGKSVFCFGTGGSIANLEGVENLRDKNLMIVTVGPLYLYKKYGIMPSIWLIHNPDSIEMFLKEVGEIKLDFSETFILVPGNLSDSKVHFDSIVIRKLRKKYPEAVFVLYNEIFETVKISDKQIKNVFKKGEEPIKRMDGSTLELLFIPVCAFLGIKEIYFSGVDHMDTGHFWDRERKYQLKTGKLINFDDNNIIENAKSAQRILKREGINVYRLEKEETVLKVYPFIDFEKALSQTSERINP